MKILIAPDSFKESLTAAEVAGYIQKGINEADPDATCICIPVADGGEGTVDSLIKATGGTLESVQVVDPLMREITSHYGILGDGKTAVIEMAAASGLSLLDAKDRDPLITSTYGTGQLIAAALQSGVNTMIIGIGGSATNDAGAGMAQALGVKLLDLHGEPVGAGGANLHRVTSIDDRNLDKRLRKIEIIVATDVTNPLCGETGASVTYGPQKGGSEISVTMLDENLAYFGKLLEKKYKKRIIDFPGSGAAGGLGAGLLAFLDAKLQPGFEVVKNITGLEKKIREVDLVITGEGKMDSQTVFGKTPYGIATLAKKYNKPVIGITGSLATGHGLLYREGFDVLLSIIREPMTLEEAIKETGQMLKSAAYNLVQLIKIGRGLK